MIKPYLADVTPLPVHPTKRHPVTGAPLQALGFRRNGDPIWPVMGASQPLGGPAPAAVQPQGVQFGGQQPAGQFVPGLGGVPVPVLAPVAQQPHPQVQPSPQPMYGQQPMFGQPAGAPVQQQQMYGQQPQMGVTPAAPQYPMPLPFQFQPAYGQNGQPAGVPQFGQQLGQQPLPQFGQQQAGQQQVVGQQQQGGGQPAGPQQQGAGAQPQGGGQQTGTDSNSGVWDRPYPQGVALTDMTPEQQITYWKWHNRKLEDRVKAMGDYDQIRAQLGQLQQMTQTEWQRAVLEAEQRGTAKAMEQAAGQMVAVAFQGAAQTRMSPDQIHAHLRVLDPRQFVVNGQVDIAAIQAHVDAISPSRQNGLIPLIPQGQQFQQLPLQQVPLGQPGGQLQPGTPGYAQQPTFGPIGQPMGAQNGGQQPLSGQVFGQPAYAQQQQAYGQQMQVPVPGMPVPYQPAMQVVSPVVQPAGQMALPSLGGRQMLPAAADFGQGAAVPGAPINATQSGAATAAARHGGMTRSAQLARTRGL